MAAALPAHRGYGDEWFANVVGPFLCPASRIDELADTLGEEAALVLGIIVDTGVGGIAAAVHRCLRDDPLTVHSLEVPLRADTDLGSAARRAATALLDAGAPDDLIAYVEVPRGPSAPAALDVLGEYGLRAKLRTGGTDASAVPSEAEVAAFITACLDRELTFKLTAGLHHAVRHTDRTTSQDQHGFVNVLVAVDAALEGASSDELAATLAQRDEAVLARQAGDIDEQRARSLRRWFASYGSCSIIEPVDDLVALGLLTPPAGVA